MSSSPAIAGSPGECCVKVVKHEGTAAGKIVKIGPLETYISEPPTESKKIILFLPDIHGAFFLNNQLLQDYFASQGYLVLGPEYFEGDIFLNHTEEGFDLFAWLPGAFARARAVWPKWVEAVKEKYGTSGGVSYFAAGYCFGAPFTMEADWIKAGAIAHPANLDEDHFKNLKRPLLFSCAESDITFPRDRRHRAEEILVEGKKTYHFQIFSGVEHGFAVRGDPTVENTRWAKEQSARAFLEWFERFSDL